MTETLSTCQCCGQAAALAPAAETWRDIWAEPALITCCDRAVQAAETYGSPAVCIAHLAFALATSPEAHAALTAARIDPCRLAERALTEIVVGDREVPPAAPLTTSADLLALLDRTNRYTAALGSGRDTVTLDALITTWTHHCADLAGAPVLLRERHPPRPAARNTTTARHSRAASHHQSPTPPRAPELDDRPNHRPDHRPDHHLSHRLHDLSQQLATLTTLVETTLTARLATPRDRSGEALSATAIERLAGLVQRLERAGQSHAGTVSGDAGRATGRRRRNLWSRQRSLRRSRSRMRAVRSRDPFLSDTPALAPPLLHDDDPWALRSTSPAPRSAPRTADTTTHQPGPFEPDDDIAFDAADEGNPNAKRFYLSLDDDILRAPSIGQRTADRLTPHGINDVRALLNADPFDLAERIDARHITAARIEDWQMQARLVCTIPWLRGTHAQLLVGAGYTTAGDIQSATPEDLSAGILKFAATRDGQRILRSGPPPELEKVRRWAQFAELAELDRAA